MIKPAIIIGNEWLHESELSIRRASPHHVLILHDVPYVWMLGREVHEVEMENWEEVVEASCYWICLNCPPS